jgi:hypothetical protein
MFFRAGFAQIDPHARAENQDGVTGIAIDRPLRLFAEGLCRPEKRRSQ